MAFTGKAASVLGSKLKNHGVMIYGGRDFVGTIHSLIYRPIEENDELTWELKKDSEVNFDLIIVDEASMINEELFRDLSSFRIPILAVGDHGQLPPISGQLNLVEKPDFKLEKIHRQAEGNPIIHVSRLAREEGFVPYQKFSDKVMKLRFNKDKIREFVSGANEDFTDTAILCGFNRTRVNFNDSIRKVIHKDRKTDGPIPGDRVICLKNNRRAKNCAIFNGMQGTVKKVYDFLHRHRMTITMDGEENNYVGSVAISTFGNEKPDFNENKFNKTDQFDFGYALTVHKAQGSSWKRVLVIEQPCMAWSGLNWNKWLYTAVTRAEQELIIMRGD